jgi:hypothetical protein
MRQGGAAAPATAGVKPYHPWSFSVAGGGRRADGTEEEERKRNSYRGPVVGGPRLQADGPIN